MGFKLRKGAFMTWLRRAALTALTLVIGIGLSGVPTASADSAVKPKKSAITVSGAGFGHGRGMSQYGAQQAAKKGLKYSAILNFYYAGTSLTKLSGSKTLRVWITSDNDNSLHVKPASGLRVRDSANRSYVLPTGSKYVRWRITLSGGKRVLSWRNSAGTWVKVKGTKGLDPKRAWYFENTKSNRVTVVLPTGATTYRGKIAARVVSGKLRTVNHVSIQNYLRSVVPAEMPAYWHTEALKAQSVAARTYAEVPCEPCRQEGVRHLRQHCLPGVQRHFGGVPHQQCRGNRNG